MTRLARIVIPEIPHHITQRGNRKQTIFFGDDDRRLYLRLLKEQSERFGISIWAYCLMGNHVHLIAVPKNEHSFSLGFGETHRRYTSIVNYKQGWTGHLWESRFASFPLDERHLYAAMRYVELNPVRAGVVKRAEEYPWSSARAHVMKEKDPLLVEHFLHETIKDWAEFLCQEEEKQFIDTWAKHVRTGRPFGDPVFLERLEKLIGRVLRPRKPGRKPKK